MSLHESSAGQFVHLSDRERVVLCCAIEYALDTGVPVQGAPEEEVEATLEKHHKSADTNSRIAVQPGMDELYQTVFQEYARALQETVPEGAFGEKESEFFEGAFKGVVGKIRDATGF